MNKARSLNSGNVEFIVCLGKHVLIVDTSRSYVIIIRGMPHVNHNDYDLLSTLGLTRLNIPHGCQFAAWTEVHIRFLIEQ